MKPTAYSTAWSLISGLLVVLALAFGPVGCQDGAVWVLPEQGSIQQGAFELKVYWSPGMVPSTLQVSINDQEITSSMSPTSASPFTGTEVGGVVGLLINPLPGRKLLSAQMQDANGMPYGATSIFTSTSWTPRSGFAGGAMVFECKHSFMNSAYQIPGFDLDLGFSEGLCAMLPISGVFPSGDSAFRNR